TSAGEPQNSQFCPTLEGSNTITARHDWHWTLRRSVCQPRSSSGSSRSALTRSSSTTLPCSRSILYGDSVPQNGHTSFCVVGFHSACAPQAGHSYFSSAAICPVKTCSS